MNIKNSFVYNRDELVYRKMLGRGMSMRENISPSVSKYKFPCKIPYIKVFILSNKSVYFVWL